MYNYNKKNLIASIFITMIIIFLFSYFAVFYPLKNELENSLENNFLNKVSISEISIENRLERYKEGTKSISSRTMIKNKLNRYNNGEISLKELEEYTQSKYIDGVKALDNVLAAFRIADRKIIAKYGDIDFKNIASNYDNSSNKRVINLINKNSSALINYPILNDAGDEIGRDLIIYDLSKFMKDINNNNIKYELVKANNIINQQSEDDYMIEYRDILNTNSLLKASKSKTYLYKSLNSITAKIITAVIIMIIIFLVIFYKIINNAFNNIISELKEKIKKLNESKILLENLTNQVPGALYQFQSKADGSYFFPYASNGFKKLFDIDPKEVKENIELIYPKININDFDEFLRSIKYSKDNLTAWHNDFRIKTSQNEFRWLEGSAQPERLDSGETLWHGYIRDITERKKEKNRLEVQHQFQKAFSDLSSNLVKLNSNNYERKIHRSLSIIGNFFDIEYIHIVKLSNDKKYFSSIHQWNKNKNNFSENKMKNLSVKKIPWWLKQFNNKNNFTICNVENLQKEAENDKIFLKSRNIKSAAAVSIVIDGELFGWYAFGNINEKGICQNIKIKYINLFTGLMTRAISKNLNTRKIEKLTYYDALTGLYNRRFFEEEVKRLDTDRNLPISILVADLNGLKIINDSYGHDKGDDILKRSAQILKSALRKDEILARQGGDEFAAILTNTSSKDIKKIIKRIKKKCSETKNKDMIPISIALGTATKEKSKEDINDIVKKADDKMYKNKLSESRSSKSNIVKGLINVLNAKSSETKEHAVRMTSLAVEFAETLGLSNFEQNRLSILATLHDIGKINISEKILKKKTSLTEKEWEIIKKHSEYGYKITLASEEFASVAEDILAHHERWDGTGYPDQLKGEEIPYLARIITIIDAYDVMTNDRPYSKAISQEEALEEIKNCSGSQFEPELAKSFIKMIKNKK